jgi:hypothetical protein
MAAKAYPVTLRLECNPKIKKPRMHLEVLVLPNPTKNEYRISYEAGMKVIGHPSKWLLELPFSQKKLEKLLQNNFSGEVKQCVVNTPEESRVLETLCVEDWLTIWELFGINGNKKAVTVLKYLAIENLTQRVEKILKQLPVPVNYLISPEVQEIAKVR